MWSLHASRILFSYKKNEVLIHAIDTTWMNLENLMLSEISQTQKDKHDSTYTRYFR